MPRSRRRGAADVALAGAPIPLRPWQDRATREDDPGLVAYVCDLRNDQEREEICGGIEGCGSRPDSHPRTSNPSDDAAGHQSARTTLPVAGSSSRPHRSLSFKCRKSLQQPKALNSAGGSMIAASSKGDMLEGPTHLSNNQPKARSMETTSKARASNGKKSPVNIERQLGAAADQSMPSKFILIAMIIEQRDYL